MRAISWFRFMHRKYRCYDKLRQGNVLPSHYQMVLGQMRILKQDDLLERKAAFQPVDILFMQALNAGNHAGMDGYGQGVRPFSHPPQCG